MPKHPLPAAITDVLKASTLRLLAFGALAVVLLHPASVAAAKATGVDPAGLPSVQANDDTLGNILQVFFGIIGAFAVLMVTASGFKYITSSGDPQKTSEARRGIAYSLVGLAIAVSAEAIVAFLINRAT